MSEAHAAPSDQAAYDLSNLHVLLVEDNKYMQLLLQNVLRTFKIRRVQTAPNGAEAFKLMRAIHPDIVICDWQMDEVDGVEFTRLVRTGVDSPNPYVPIIMLTGHSEVRRIFEARDAGITEYLVKPISAEMIYERICRVIERPRQFVKTQTFFGPDRRRSKPTPNTNKGRRAEDNEANAAGGADEIEGDSKAISADDASPAEG